ncbi:YerC/YecD family TrpR-related protein [Candidatus Gracilibacteria bacterium]|nr:YerC/YecD family TrpR-related protein [Candidatus Gracilibacteria bacterium]
MKKKELEYELESITEVLSKINSKDRVLDFLLDLMTEKEMLEFSRRFEVAKMLDQGISYTRIEKKTGMSSTTIARISKALKGSNMGYMNAINIIKGEY